jgi:hypothetical protein
MCTYEPAGTVYSLDNGVPVSKKLAVDVVNPQRLQGDLFLRPNEDGLFSWVYPDVACGRMTRALTSPTTTLTNFGTSLEPFKQNSDGQLKSPLENHVVRQPLTWWATRTLRASYGRN